MKKILSRISITSRKSLKAFTLMELLVVITIIAILAALILNTAGFVQRKAARARAESEIKAIETALESFKSDMGDYPVSSTNGTPTTTNTAPTGNAFFIDALSPTATNGINPLKKVYMEFSKNMISTNTNGTLYITDPFGEPYGYYYASTNINGTTNNAGVMNGVGFFDLWSRCATANSNQWVTNW